MSSPLAEIDEGSLSSLFETVGPLVSVKVPAGKNCAFVQYYSPQHAEYAIATLNGVTVRAASHSLVVSPFFSLPYTHTLTRPCARAGERMPAAASVEAK